jgi:hypothetical protein
MIARFQELVAAFDGRWLPLAFADVSFRFPERCRYPSLCVHLEKYGLINPLEGRTVATLPEVALALRQGAVLDYHDACVIEPLSPERFLFREHLQGLIEARSAAKARGDELEQQLLKLYVNTLYGKLAQGIHPKSSFDLLQSETRELKASAVTQPYLAAMITGTVRAALHSVLDAMESLNAEGYDYRPISATTDGLLYVVGDPDVRFEACFASPVESGEEALRSGASFAPFATVDPVLARRLERYPTLRLLQRSRQAWGFGEYLEIKHALNIVLNFKTRGQIGGYHAA